MNFNLRDPKTKFYLFRNQAGGGCDYTIGCGKELTALRAQTLEEAIAEASGYDNGYNIADVGEYTLDDAMIFAAPVHVFDLNTMRIERRAAAEATSRAKEEERERAELERLSKKYK